MKTLIMLSGGLDSTVALLKLLTETADIIHVHHIYYYTNEGRGDAETVAISKIVPYCQKIRSFEYTTSIQDYTQLFCCYDVHVVRWTASQICRGNNNIQRVVSGHCKDDVNPNVISTAIFNACLSGNPRNITWHYPCNEMTKYDEKKYITDNHPDLLNFIHYCRKPIKINDQWVNCNKCHTCKQMANLHWSYILSDPSL